MTDEYCVVTGKVQEIIALEDANGAKLPVCSQLAVRLGRAHVRAAIAFCQQACDGVLPIAKTRIEGHEPTTGREDRANLRHELHDALVVEVMEQACRHHALDLLEPVRSEVTDVIRDEPSAIGEAALGGCYVPRIAIEPDIRAGFYVRKQIARAAAEIQNDFTLAGPGILANESTTPAMGSERPLEALIDGGSLE